MKSSQIIREQLGLSQEIMAYYLGITKSLLAMYERGKREIPTAAMVKLAEMELFLNQKQKITKQESELLNKQEAKVQELIQRHSKELEYKLIKEQRKLDAIQKKYNQSLKLNSFVAHLQKNESKQATLIKLQAYGGIEINGLVVQTNKLLKIESINSQLAYCKSVKEKQKKS